MKRTTLLAALGTTLTAAFAGPALPAQAAVTSGSIIGKTATLNLDGADDNLTVSAGPTGLEHDSVGGLNSRADWDSATPGDQTVPADGTFTIVINAGDGNDAVTVLAKTTDIARTTLNGEGGDDVLTGADTNDTLNGGDGNDRLVGGPGTDTMNGGNGNDTLVWNNGDGSDTLNGDAGNDGAEVNGSATLGDVFTLEASAGRVKFQRTNLKAFTLDSSTERFAVNGLGGADSLSAADGVGALTLLSVDGGAGADRIAGSDGPDLILGGEGDDVLSGGGGDDRIAGDRGNDTMNGGSGEDTLVWNNGDNTDVINGDEGDDDVEVNGAPTAGDTFNVQPNGDRIRFERPNLVPFTLDIGSSETLHANGLGGDDAITVGDVGSFSVTASGGPGNDMLTGGPAAETFLGGSGDDTISPGGGLDVVSAGAGDDKVAVRDKAPDLALGGSGDDAVIADAADLDILDGFEHVDRTAVPPPPDTKTRPVTIAGGTLKVSNGAAPVRLTCPASSPRTCTGSLEIRTADRVKVGGLKATLSLGTARFSIAAGASRTVQVKLADGIRRLADGKGHIKAIVFASTGDAGAIAPSSRRVTLALGKQSKKR